MAIWPIYAAVPQLKVVIPSVIADEHEREQLGLAGDPLGLNVEERQACFCHSAGLHRRQAEEAPTTVQDITHGTAGAGRSAVTG